ncbi:MAG: carbohydrate porin [Chthoniobacterales bacterium]
MRAVAAKAGTAAGPLDRPERKKAYRLFSLVILWLLAGVLSAPVSTAEPDPQPTPRVFFPDQPKGLGDHFTAWKFNYVGEVFGNLSGGIRQGAIYEGYVKVGLGFNLEKLLGWKNTVFYTNLFYPHGTSLSQVYVGDLNTVSNIDTYDSLRIFKLFLQTNCFDDRLTLRLGILAVDKDFFGSEGAGLFLNSGFGAFPVIGQDLVAPIYPVSAPGFRVTWSPTKAVLLRAAVFNGDVGTAASNRNGAQFDFSGRNGVGLFGEVAWKTRVVDDLSGVLKLGGFYNSKTFDDLRHTGTHRGNYGFYVIGDQQLWREGTSESAAAQGLAVFGRFAIAPPDRSLVVYDIEAGVTYTGLFPGRDSDVLGAGFLYSRVSNDAFTDSGTPLPSHHEAVIEVSYQASLTSFLTIQPDFQYIMNPGAVRPARDAIVAGMRFSLAY